MAAKTKLQIQGEERLAKWESMGTRDRETLKQDDPETYDMMRAPEVAIRARESFWVFLVEVLRNPVIQEDFHREIAEWLEDNQWKKLSKLLLMPRGWVKSNIFTVGYPLWQIVKNPSIRILLASHKDDDAEKFLQLIKEYIEADEWFQMVFPEIVPAAGNNKRPKKWTEKVIQVKRDERYVEPTIQCTSPNTNVTGRHYDLAVCDDLVTRHSTNSPEQIQKTANFHELLQNLLDPGARELLLGTRYHYDDRYGQILETKELRNTFDIKIYRDTKTAGLVNEYISGRTKWERSHDYEQVRFYTRFTLAPNDFIHPTDKNQNRKSLPLLRLKQGPTTYANQMQMEPMDPSSAEFKEADFTIVPCLPEGVHFEYYQFLDMASERATFGSKTALVTVAVSRTFDIYFIDVFRGDFGIEKTTDELIRWQEATPRLRPQVVGVQKGPYEIQLKTFAERRMQELGIMIPFKEVPGTFHSQDKLDHIRRLCPWAGLKKLFILENCRDRHQLLDEFIKFPKTKWKDCVDAAAQITELVLPSSTIDFLACSVPEKDAPDLRNTCDAVFEEMMQGDKEFIGSHQIMHETVRF